MPSLTIRASSCHPPHPDCFIGEIRFTPPRPASPHEHKRNKIGKRLLGPPQQRQREEHHKRKTHVAGAPSFPPRDQPGPITGEPARSVHQNESSMDLRTCSTTPPFPPANMNMNKNSPCRTYRDYSTALLSMVCACDTPRKNILLQTHTSWWGI